MKSTKRSSSGAVIPYHSKGDRRGAQIKKGTRLKKDTKITFHDEAGLYKVGNVTSVLKDAAGVAYNDLRWITNKCLLAVICDGKPTHVVVTHRYEDRLLGKQL